MFLIFEKFVFSFLFFSFQSLFKLQKRIFFFKNKYKKKKKKKKKKKFKKNKFKLIFVFLHFFFFFFFLLKSNNKKKKQFFHFNFQFVNQLYHDILDVVLLLFQNLHIKTIKYFQFLLNNQQVHRQNYDNNLSF